MSWTFDAATGTYRNHALSSDIRREAIADAVFMQFPRVEPGYGRHAGESITITRVLKLPPAGRVSELDELPAGRPPIQTREIKVEQRGYKVPLTEFEMHLTHFDITNVVQQALRDQLSLTMDIMVAEALKATKYKYIPTSATSGTFQTADGSPTVAASANLSVGHLREIHDELHGMLKCPKFRGGRYVGVLSTKAARGIKNDPEYKAWLAPTTREPFLTGMVADVEGFLLFESNHSEALLNSIGTNGVLGEAVFFGADSVVFAEVLTPELRVGWSMNIGLYREIGWYGIIGAGLTWETASLSRVIHVTSA